MAVSLTTSGRHRRRSEHKQRPLPSLHDWHPDVLRLITVSVGQLSAGSVFSGTDREDG